MNKHMVVVADGARASLFVVEKDATLQVGSRLVKKADLLNADYLARGKDAPQVKTERNTNSESGPMQTQGAMRDRHRAELERRFAHDVAAKCAELLKTEPRGALVLVAGARMLGYIREPLHKALAKSVVITELARSYTRLSPHTLHLRLTEHHLLPQGG